MIANERGKEIEKIKEIGFHTEELTPGEMLGISRTCGLLFFLSFGSFFGS